MTFEFEKVNQTLKASYGEQNVIVKFIVTHKAIHSIYTNKYIVNATLNFISAIDVELVFDEVVECLNESNEDTLTNEALLDLCNDERN